MHEDEVDYRAFLAGENTGFERIVLRHREGLIYFVYRYVKNLHLAEEIAQDTFVEILLHKERYHFKVSFKTYLYTIGRNKSVDYIRKHKKEQIWDELCEDYPEQERQALEQRVLRREEKELLYVCLKQLKDEYQQIIYLIDLEGMSYAQAATVLGKTLPQVKVLVHRARKALKKCMEQEGYIYEN